MTALSGLYYPFSRTISLSSLKQMLLVFDSVTFLDPVSDNDWRAQLFHQLETEEDQQFDKYQDVHRALPLLMEAGAVARRDPGELSVSQADATAGSALSDLLDPDWVRIASNPGAFRMPHRSLASDGGATWQAFEPKLPKGFVNALKSARQLRRHLVREGTEDSSWTLTYEAGSAAAMSVHLAAAEHIGLAPVTDSEMHHRLLLQKLVRAEGYGVDRERPLSKNVITQLTQSAAILIVDEIVPHHALSSVSFDEILRFRESTTALRRQAIADISRRLEVLSRIPEPDELVRASKEIQTSLRKELSTYRTEIASARDRLWPTLIGSIGTTLAPGSAAAVAMNYIGGPGHALAASIVAGALAIIKGALDIRAERHKSENSAAPAVAYLSQVGNLR